MPKDGPLVVLALAATILGAASAAAEDLTVTVVNKTGVPLKEFYLSPVGAHQWKDNLVKAAPLDSGDKADLTVANGRGTCDYDILSVFSDGDKVQDSNVDLCGLGSYTLHN